MAEFYVMVDAPVVSPEYEVETRPRAQQANASLTRAAQLALGHSDFVDVLQVSRRGGLAVIREDGALKVFKFIGCQADWKKRYARFIGWNPARRAMNMSRELGKAGISVCEVENFGNVSLPEAPRAVWTISRYVEGGRTLRQLKQTLQPDRLSPADPSIEQLFIEGVKLLRRIHDAGFEHRDYHAGNLLVVERSLRLVDLETVMQRKAIASRRARDLRRYVENFVEPHDFSEVIERALQAYAPAEPDMQAAIRTTRRMQGLIRKRGER